MITFYPHQSAALEDTKSFNKCAQIQGYEGLYEIDEFGTIYSLVQNNSRRKGPIKPFINSSGYLRINLYDSEGKGKKYYIHRLVASAFIPNPNCLKVVNHKDCNKLNNHYSNLEWCTQQQNVQHSMDNGLQRNIEVEIYDVTTDEKYTFQSMRKASEFLGRCPNYISSHLKEGECFAHGKYLVTRYRKE